MIINNDNNKYKPNFNTDSINVAWSIFCDCFIVERLEISAIPGESLVAFTINPTILSKISCNWYNKTTNCLLCSWRFVLLNWPLWNVIRIESGPKFYK